MSQPQTQPAEPSQPTQPEASGRDPRVGCFLFILLFGVLFASRAWIGDFNESRCVTNWTEHQDVFDANLVNSLNAESKFELNFADDVWTTQFLDLNAQNTTRFDWIFSYDADGETAVHYPAMPYISYLGIRKTKNNLYSTVTSWLLVFGLALLVWSINKHFGWVPAIVCAVLIIGDVGLQMSTVSSVGDGLIAALIVLSFVTVIQNRNAAKPNQAIWKYPVAGVLLGATTLFQFQQSLWLIVLLIGWLIHVVGTLIMNRKSFGPFMEGSALFIVGLVIVVAPWWVRNCKVTGEFKPLGYAVDTYLAGAYSDDAVLFQGDLDAQAIYKFREQAVMPLEGLDLSLIEKEKVVADANVEAAAIWREDNPSATLTLMIQRVKNHLGFGTPGYAVEPDWIVIATGICSLIGMLGCFLCWHRMGNIVFFVCLASLAVTALTWSDGGRLFIPVRPLLYATCAVGLARIVGLCKKPVVPVEHQAA